MNPQTLRDAATKFLENLKTRSRASLTIVAYQNDLAQLVEFLSKLGKTSIDQVNQADIESFKTDLETKKYTAKSIARKLNAVKGLFRWLASNGQINSDPAKPVAHPKYSLSAPRILSPLEYRALRDASREDPRIAAIVELLLQTGMRISEVASLSLANLTDGKIKLDKREITVNSAIQRAIQVYQKQRPRIESKHLFITKTGKQLLVRNIRAAIERYFAEAGIEEATVNDLRNTFIVHQLSAGVDLVTVSRVVGHKRISTTERYLEFVKNSQNRKTEKLKEL